MKNKNGYYMLSKLEKRVLEISYKYKLSHIGSCLTAVRLIDHFFLVKKPGDIFILSSGHAGVALYAVIEKFGGKNAEEIYKHHGVHPDRCDSCGITATSGSLGHGIGIAVGMALTNKDRQVYVLMSDGECAEGSVWEALRIAADLRLENLGVMVNANGWGAYGRIEAEALDTRLQFFYPSLVQRTNLFEWPDYLQSQEAHYHVLTDEEYKELTNEIILVKSIWSVM